MSHTTRISTQLKDLAVLSETCESLHISFNESEHVIQLYGSAEQVIASFQLSGWRYPVGIKEDGSIVFDNFNEHWGKREKLNRVLQAYAGKIVKKEAFSKGYSVVEKYNADGSIDLEIETGGEI